MTPRNRPIQPTERIAQIPNGQHLFVETVRLSGVLVSGLGGLLDFGGPGLTVSRSFNCNSISITSLSRMGSTLPSVNTLPSSKRSTCKMASVSRMFPRNLLPRPPLARPFYKPGNVHNLLVVNHILWIDQFGELLQPRVGNPNAPTLSSMVQNSRSVPWRWTSS